MDSFNAGLTLLAELLLRPVAALPAALGLALGSALCGVLLALAFRFASNQRALMVLADRARAELLAIKLFREDLGVTFVCHVRLAVVLALRLGHALPPTLVLAGPLFLILVQLALRYEHRPLAPGEAAVVELELAADRWSASGEVTLEAPAGMAVETEPLRDEHTHTICWRIRPQVVPAGPLRWAVGGRVFEKELAVAEDPARLRLVSVRRPGTRWSDRLLHPAEPALDPGGAVRAIVVHQPRRATPILGVAAPWWASFLLLSMLSARLVRPLLSVQC